MKPRSKGALWANDDPAAAPSATKQPQQQPGGEARQPKRKRAALEADATAAAVEVRLRLLAHGLPCISGAAPACELPPIHDCRAHVATPSCCPPPAAHNFPAALSSLYALKWLERQPIRPRTALTPPPAYPPFVLPDSPCSPAPTCKAPSGTQAWQYLNLCLSLQSGRRLRMWRTMKQISMKTFQHGAQQQQLLRCQAGTWHGCARLQPKQWLQMQDRETVMTAHMRMYVRRKVRALGFRREGGR